MLHEVRVRERTHGELRASLAIFDPLNRLLLWIECSSAGSPSPVHFCTSTSEVSNSVILKLSLSGTLRLPKSPSHEAMSSSRKWKVNTPRYERKDAPTRQSPRSFSVLLSSSAISALQRVFSE